VHKGGICSVATNLFGSAFLTAGEDGTMKTFNIMTGELMSTFPTNLKDSNAAAFSPCNRYISLRSPPPQSNKVIPGNNFSNHEFM